MMPADIVVSFSMFFSEFELDLCVASNIEEVFFITKGEIMIAFYMFEWKQ